MTPRKKKLLQKTEGEGFIEAIHTNKATGKETVVESGIYGFGFKGGEARLSFSREVPCQLASYMYMKTSIGLEIPVNEDVQSIEEAYLFAESWVDKQIQRVLDTYAGAELKKIDAKT